MLRQLFAAALIVLLLANQSVAALSDNLTACWTVDEASGNRADSSANAITLTDNATVTTATAKVGTNAAQFTSANSEYLSSNSTSLQIGTNNATYAIWVYADTLPGTMTILGAGDPGGGASAFDYNLRYSAGLGNKFAFSVSDGASTTDAVWGTGPSTATWYFIVVWHDATNDQIGISVNNGTPVTASWSANVATSHSSSFRVGADTTGRYWNGRMDEGARWGRVIASADITELYNSGSGRSCSYILGGTTKPKRMVIIAE